MKGSTPVLAALVVAFLLAFFQIRGCSRFLALEAQVDLARELAARHGLTVPEALALGELVDGAADPARWRAAAAAFAGGRARLGAELAVVAASGQTDLVEQAFAAAGGDAGRAWERLRPHPAALAAGRFAAMRDRFAARTQD